MKTGWLVVPYVSKKSRMAVPHMAIVPQAHITTFHTVPLFPVVNNASFNSVPGMQRGALLPITKKISLFISDCSINLQRALKDNDNPPLLLQNNAFLYPTEKNEKKENILTIGTLVYLVLHRYIL